MNGPWTFPANYQIRFLSSGRWFSSSGLNGPWVYATPDLPSDFLKIPDNSPASAIMAFVPGSEQAADAVMITQTQQYQGKKSGSYSGGRTSGGSGSIGRR